MRRVTIAVVCVLLCPALASAAEDSSGFRFYKQIDRGQAAGEEILGATLDSDVYATAADGFPDIRVLDKAGLAVPFRMEKATEGRNRIVKQDHSAKVVSLVENDDNSVEILVERGAKAPDVDGVIFFTPLKNYERRVSISGSKAGEEWEQLVNEAMIFDYTRYMDVSNREVPLPKNNHRQFKIVIQDVTDQQQSPLMELTRRFQDDEEDGRTERTTVQRRPFRIDRIGFWNEAKQEQYKSDKTADYPIVEFAAEEDTKEKTTVVTVRARRQPLTGFSLVTDSNNFSRAAAVQVAKQRGVTTVWQDVGNATISQIRFRGFHREHLKVDFPETRAEEYRIVIQNADSPPLVIDGVEAEGNIHQAVFMALADEAYRVYYGSEEAKQPSYDTAAVLAALKGGYQAVPAELGPETENADFGVAPDLAIGRLLKNEYFFGFVICLVVVVLTWGLYRAGRRIEQLPADDGPSQ